VPGIPVTQGSGTIITSRSTGRAFFKYPPKLAPWRADVKAAAAYARRLAGLTAPIDSPVRLWVTFYLPRPQSLPKRDTMPRRKPDLSKLIRAAEDAMTGVLLVDDARIVDVIASKRYDPFPRAELVVEEIAQPPPTRR
jgi:Holliday junction resolvase RusA-like endonuclease